MWSRKWRGRNYETKNIIDKVYRGKELELYDWLRRQKYETGLAMAEIVRQALEMFREKKEDKRNEDLGENRLQGDRSRI